jgi:hypothetical protein
VLEGREASLPSSSCIRPWPIWPMGAESKNADPMISGAPVKRAAAAPTIIT